MGSGCSCSVKEPTYQNGVPLVTGGKVTPCFEQGKLFKIEKQKTWYFYNDTQDSTMSVSFAFGAGSEVEALGNSVVAHKGDGGACTVTLKIPPLETEPFVKLKAANGFTSEFAATPFTQQEQDASRRTARQQVQKEMEAMLALAKKHKVQNVHKLLKHARKADKPFVDLYFPPADRSLHRPGVDAPASGALARVENFCWRRPEQYLPPSWKKKISIFDGGVRSSDIAQGQLGDCYFLCSCAALAEYPKHIEGSFKNHHWCYVERCEHSCGGWRVTLNIHGWWRTCIIDSYLPSRSLLPSFARNRYHPNELWVSFMEKAYAKVYGSYAAIEGGYSWQALEDLTGFPAFCFDSLWKNAVGDTNAQKKLFDLLDQWSEKNYLLTISTPGALTTAANGGSGELTKEQMQVLFDKAGLSTGHAYTVLRVRHFPLHQLCMLKIRNPWGDKVKWLGDWSDDSDLWRRYPIIKALCRPEKKADGVFWMEWKDVTKFFNSGCVCFRSGKWFHNWHDYRIPGHFEHEVPSVALEIITETDFSAYFSLYQKDKRGLPASDPDASYAAIMLSLTEGEVSGGRQEVVANSNENPQEPQSEYLFQITRNVGIYYKLQKQKKYFIVPRRMFNGGKNRSEEKKFVLSMVSSQKVSGKSLQVNIVRLDKNNALFNNIRTVDVGNVTSVSTVYQVKDGNNLFSAKEGTSLNKGTSVQAPKYEFIM